jgi:hypothetical protein
MEKRGKAWKSLEKRGLKGAFKGALKHGFGARFLFFLTFFYLFQVSFPSIFSKRLGESFFVIFFCKARPWFSLRRLYEGGFLRLRCGVSGLGKGIYWLWEGFIRAFGRGFHLALASFGSKRGV